MKEVSGGGARFALADGPSPIKKTRARVETATQPRVDDAPVIDALPWHLEPHACRLCFGRMVSRPTAFGLRVYQCTNCGVESEGSEVSILCCCGMKIRKPLRDHRSGNTMMDAGVRCHLNPDPSPEFPSLIVASEASG